MSWMVTLCAVALAVCAMAACWHMGRRMAAMGDVDASCAKPTGVFDGDVEAERRFIEAMPDAVILCDGHGVVRYLSHDAQPFAFVSSGRIVVPDLEDLLQRVTSDGRVREREIAYEPRGEDSPRAGGDGRGMRAGSSVSDDAMVVRVRIDVVGTGLYAIFLRDVGEQRRFELMRRDFLTNVSHELKTPAGAIALLAETISDAADDPQAVRYFSGRVSTEAHRLISLIRHQIDLQRVQSLQGNPDLRPVSVVDSVREAVSQNMVQAQAKGIGILVSLFGHQVDPCPESDRLSLSDGQGSLAEDRQDSQSMGDSGHHAAGEAIARFDRSSQIAEPVVAAGQPAIAELSEGVPNRSAVGTGASDTAQDVWAMADDESLVRALKNLIENAIHYSPSHTTVGIGIAERDGRVVIRVVDQGIGIPQRSLRRIFERFYRVDPARSRQTGGSGLGLSIVRHCVQECGGTVSVWSREGEGSTFTVELPVAAQDHAAPSREDSGDGEACGGDAPLTVSGASCHADPMVDEVIRIGSATTDADASRHADGCVRVAEDDAADDRDGDGRVVADCDAGGGSV